MSGWSPELHPRDEGGRFAESGAVAALERVRPEKVHGEWGKSHIDQDVQDNIDYYYTFVPDEFRGTEPNTADVINLDDVAAGYAEGTVAIYRGPDGRDAGMVHWSNDLRTPYIGAVEVMPSMRGQGIGMAMYDYLQDHTVDLYDMIGRAHTFTPAGKAFAEKWLESRIERGL